MNYGNYFGGGLPPGFPGMPFPFIPPNQELASDKASQMRMSAVPFIPNLREGIIPAIPLFSNVDAFKESIDDCDLALQLNRDNIKAYYRKAVALKSRKMFPEAMKAAIEGKERASSCGKIKEAKEFDELLREIESHLPEIVSRSDNKPAAGVEKSKSALPAKPKMNDSKKEQPKAVVKQTEIDDKTVKSSPAKRSTVSTVNSGAEKGSKMSSASIDIKKQSSAAGVKHLDDNSIATKVLHPSTKSKKSDNSLHHDEQKTKYSGRFSTLLSDDDGDSSDEITEIVTGLEKTTISVKNTVGMDLDQITMSGHIDSAKHVLEPSAPARSLNSKSQMHASELSSTLSWGDRVMASSDNLGPVRTASVQHYVAPTKVEAIPVKVNAPAVQPVMATSNMFSSQSGPKDLLSGQIVPLQSKRRLPYPFDTKYDFNLLCERCYQQRRPGPTGYVSMVHLPHQCIHDVLVVRSKAIPGDNWSLIRPRNTKVAFRGPYKICHDFAASNPCKQTPCAFAHYDEEVHIWQLDREGQFDLVNFVREQQQNLISGVLFSPESSSAKTPTSVQSSPYTTYTGDSAQSLTPARSGISVEFVNGRYSHEYAKTTSHTQPRIQPQAPVVTSMPSARLGDTSSQLQGIFESSNPKYSPDGKLLFPLSSSFSFRIVCDVCLRPTSTGRYSTYCILDVHGPDQPCLQNVLAVQHLLGNAWSKVRELRIYRPFRGMFVMCRQYSAGVVCSYDERCSFPHSLPEQLLWSLEKEGKFSVSQFIADNRTVPVVVFDVGMFLAKHPGELGYICFRCFVESQLVVVQSSEFPLFCGQKVHMWNENRVLIHYSVQGEINLIGHRIETSPNAFFKLCSQQRFCANRWSGSCVLAHSLVERDLWCVERDLGITRDQIIEEAKKILYLKQAEIASAQPVSQQLPSGHSQPVAASRPPASHSASSSSRESARASPAPPAAAAVSQHVPTTPNVVAVCGLCLQQKGNVVQRGAGKAGDRCAASSGSHLWDANRVFILLPSRKKVNQLPKRVPMNARFSLCRHMQLNRQCDWVIGGCQFAHSNEEIDLWKWMVDNNVKTLEEVVVLNQTTKTEVAAPTAGTVSTPAPWKVIKSGQSVVEAMPSSLTVNRQSLFSLAVNAHYCQYCSVHCNGQKQWDEHCASDKHSFNVNSDREHQWNYRQPPWGIAGADYELCGLHENGGRCKFSDVPDMYNQCTFAHSREELDEWKERYEWRQMKREIAKEQHLYSYMEQLRDEYENTSSGINVIAEEVGGIVVKCSNDLLVYEEKKDASQSWRFEVQTKKSIPLLKVALLYDRDRLHFALHSDDFDRDCQIAPGEAFLEYADDKSHIYNVEVIFTGGLFGSFSQWVIFDFGERPVLVRKVNVELGTSFVQDKVRSLRENLKFDRWTSDNRRVVLMECTKQAIEGDFSNEILQRYKAPSTADTVVTQATVGVGLNRHNYVHKMHKLIQIEELTRAQIMARYNLKTEVTLVSNIEERDGFVSARPGELFARVPLTEQLNDDTDAGHLILSGVTRVLLAPQHTSSKTVYEAELVQMENFNYNGRGSDYIYLCLSASCCRELQFEAGKVIEVEIQFQMNRLPFCQMHYAIDQLLDTELVFPDVSKIERNWNENNLLQLRSAVLNEDQMKIIRYITAERQGYVPPLIVNGPFGTGKTETLAQAALVLIAQNVGARILICTHSNSAADVYISRHFDSYIRKKGGSLEVLRVFSTDRRMNTISSAVRRYCLLSPDKTKILAPTKLDVVSHNIVITTLVTSLLLTKLDVRGFFTHIFVDEAAQVLENEAIMPLSLASESTVVVLAGDYKQMCQQKVYSDEAKRQRFHCSLVERLFQHYRTYAPDVGRDLPNILLSINYRTKMELVRYLSAVFYGGPDVLRSASKIPDIRGICPLTFYTAQGREIQDRESTSYYNIAEVEEIVERVTNLLQNWPVEWLDTEASPAESILVVAPYLDQVAKIRSALRKKGRELKMDLNRVSVERVFNVQGTEYHAVFVSTVRTRHLVETRPQMLYSAARECDGDFGDYGFLSDSKLLNTALSRARCHVAVVGDPVALCSVGDCTSIWRTFLKHCQNLGSIHPRTITLESVRKQVVDLMSSPFASNIQMISRMNRDAAAGNYKVLPAAVPSQNPVSQPTTTNDTCELDFAGMTIEPNPFDDITLKGRFTNWNLDYHVEPDVIVQQLVKEAIKEMQKTQSGALLGATDLVKSAGIRIRNGKAFIAFGGLEVKKSVRDRTQVAGKLGGNNSDSDATDDEDESDAATPATVYVDYIPDQLNEIVKRQPDKFKKAILVVEDSSNMYAKCIDDTDVRVIKLHSRIHCGRAFSGDEVVVELLPIEPGDLPAFPENERAVVYYGQVIGIVRRAINPKYRMFVCNVDSYDNTGVLVPINRNVPKIYNVQVHYQSGKLKKGHVCVYTFTRNREVAFHHYEPVDAGNPASKLFVVRYLKWDVKYCAPVGIVVGVVPQGVDVDTSMNILGIEHYVPETFTDDTVEELDRLYPEGYLLPTDAASGRIDCRSRTAFSISSEEETVLDNAITVEELPNSCFRIGVHVADVTHFVPRDGCLDREAYLRGTLLHRPGHPSVPLLPARLSENLCSLLPDNDRLTVSVFMTVDSKADVQQVLVRQCILRTCHRLKYLDVENFLKGNSEAVSLSDGVGTSLLLLNRVMEIWRRKRLGSCAIYSPASASDGTAQAHMIVEELMIAVDHQVALLLLEKLPKCTPLLVQLPPNDAELDEWKARFQAEARNTVALTSAFKKFGEVCNCSADCSCIPPSTEDTNMDIEKSLWDKVRLAAVSQNWDLLQSLVISPENHPQLIVALRKLQAIQRKVEYVCSGDLEDTTQACCSSLNVLYSTSFTSPLHRYIDLVVVRLVVECLIKNSTASPYSQSVITDICNHTNEVSHNVDGYEQAVKLIRSASYFKVNPIAVHAVVGNLAEKKLDLCFTANSLNFLNKLVLPVTLFGLAESPIITEFGSVVLKWAKQIFSVDETLKPIGAGTNQGELPLQVLSDKRFVYETLSSIWQNLVQAVVVGDKDAIINHLVHIHGHLVDPSAHEFFASDVVATGAKFVEFAVELHPGSVVQIQLSADVVRGLLTPQIQLLNLTTTLDLCLEHQQNVDCFCDSVTRSATRQTYNDVSHYQSCWFPVLAVEHCQQAVSGRSSAIIHNVKVFWQEIKLADKTTYVGLCEVPVQFALEHRVIFSTSADDDSDSDLNECQNNADSKLLENRCYGYMCVRCGGCKSEMSETMSSSWVGHCIVSGITANMQRESYSVKLNLHQSSAPVPREILNSFSQIATVEWIPKFPSERRVEEALCRLDTASQVAADIALGRSLQSSSLDQAYLDIASRLPLHESSSLPAFNTDQVEAVMTALTQPFTVIRGPPGTGKSLVTAKLAVLCARANSFMMQDSDMLRSCQVMVCGPTEQSVDVITRYLLKSACPRIVRVYSTDIERASYPLPSHNLAHAEKHNILTPSPDDLKAVTLHHMVRSLLGPHVTQMDVRIQMNDRTITKEEVTEYRSAIKRAENEILASAEIILCTCSSSCVTKIQHATNIFQLIIDECNMCTEPESMISIESTRASQVILIGDAKQLQPVVISETARKLGLTRSLIERYSDKAITLTKQYRMHDAIAAFPSTQFYRAQLSSAKEELSKTSALKFWPNGRNKPIAFVHVAGCEHVTSVNALKGCEQSVYNMKEVEAVVRAVSLLTLRSHVLPNDVAVLSQYDAQCAFIMNELVKKGEKTCSVLTVAAAQGCEWDYVILSMVRSQPTCKIEKRPTNGWKRRHLGHVSDTRQINVALTRAKKGLIIIGNKHLLQCDPTWKKLLAHYEDNKKVVDVSEFFHIGP